VRTSSAGVASGAGAARRLWLLRQLYPTRGVRQPDAIRCAAPVAMASSASADHAAYDALLMGLGTTGPEWTYVNLRKFTMFSLTIV